MAESTPMPPDYQPTRAEYDGAIKDMAWAAEQEVAKRDKRIAELEPAYALLKRIAEKAVEPMSDSADPNKTLGQIRSEMVPLLQEAVSFFMVRERPIDDWHYQHGWDERG